ncbi:hypothetical protein V2L00_25415 [Pseudomonas alliivorans]|nr:hypothetical protein [Pseudomonas alliivorans]
MTKSKRNAYYEPKAYRSDDIPAQNPSIREKSFVSAAVRLPWGYTQQVSPTGFMEEFNPNRMRFWEHVEVEKKSNWLTELTLCLSMKEQTFI